MFAEAGTFLMMLLAGVLVGIFYDLYRRFWLKRYYRNWRKHLGDLIFCLWVSGLILIMLYYSNWVELRIYVFLGLAFGILTYFKLISLLIRYLQSKSK